MAPTNNINDLFNVNGLVAVITGGGSGIGLYAARALDANGAKAVYILGRREETLKAAAKTGVNGSIKPLVGDISSKESLTKAAEQVRQEQGYVNFLFANAGAMGPFDIDAVKKEDGSKPSVEEFQTAMLKPGVDEFTHPLHVNATSFFYTAVAFLDLLDAGNKQGNVAQNSQVVVTTSVASFLRQLATSFSYSASKAAANHVMKLLATTFAQYGYNIRVNALAPGFFPSEMSAEMLSKVPKFDSAKDGAFADAYRLPLEQSPAGRTGSEEDIAGAVLFLASRAAAYVNGVALISDGGRLSQLPSVY